MHEDATSNPMTVFGRTLDAVEDEDFKDEVLESGCIQRDVFDRDPYLYTLEPHVGLAELEPITDLNDPNFPPFRLDKCINVRNSKIKLEVLLI